MSGPWGKGVGLREIPSPIFNDTEVHNTFCLGLDSIEMGQGCQSR